MTESKHLRYVRATKKMQFFLCFLKSTQCDRGPVKSSLKNGQLYVNWLTRFMTYWLTHSVSLTCNVHYACTWFSSCFPVLMRNVKGIMFKNDIKNNRRASPLRYHLCCTELSSNHLLQIATCIHDFNVIKWIVHDWHRQLASVYYSNINVCRCWGGTRGLFQNKHMVFPYHSWTFCLYITVAGFPLSEKTVLYCNRALDKHYPPTPPLQHHHHHHPQKSFDAVIHVCRNDCEHNIFRPVHIYLYPFLTNVCHICHHVQFCKVEIF